MELYVITHFLIGAAIGLVLADPVLAFLGGCVSHALADMTPHHDPQNIIPGLFSVVPVIGIDSLEVKKSIDSVAAVSEESAAAAEEVSTSTEELNASIQEMSASAESLAEMAQKL